MDMTQKGNKVLIKDVRHFSLKQIFECGQAFRWVKNTDDSYTGVVRDRQLTIKEVQRPDLESVDLELQPCTLEDAKLFWFEYLDLSTDYGSIKRTLSDSDPTLKMAIAYGGGIRLLNQELWEMILTFILSANNNIPRIAASLEALAQTYGEQIAQTDSKTWYSIPKPEVLAALEPEKLRALGLGYRDKYVVETAKMIASGMVRLEEIPLLETSAARKALLGFPGVGPKVAECILLFALKRRDAFPVDTWVKKVMCHFYCEEGAALKDISRFAEEHFGSLGGYAQQYLFYYARENRLGQ